MDISKASNFERFVFDIVERDPAIVRELWWELDTRGEFDFATTPFLDRVRAAGFVSGTSTHADRLQTIRDVHRETGRIIDPHTADGVKVAREHLQPGVPMICLETAAPAKFAETIRAAIGIEPARPDACAGIEAAAQRFEVLPVDVQRLKSYIEQHAG